MIEAIKQLFWSSRPISWVNTAFPFAAAYWLVAGELDLNFWVGTIFFLGPLRKFGVGLLDNSYPFHGGGLQREGPSIQRTRLP